MECSKQQLSELAERPNFHDAEFVSSLDQHFGVDPKQPENSKARNSKLVWCIYILRLMYFSVGGDLRSALETKKWNL